MAIPNQLGEDADKVSKEMSAKQECFDQVMSIVRDVVRDAAQAITQLHNDDPSGAAARLKRMAEAVKRMREYDPDFGYHTLGAYQEYAEARILYSIKTDGKVPGIKDLMLGSEAYMLGLMDVVGELKREVLDALRKGDVAKAESYYETMVLIYDSTRHLRFAEAVLSGFRKKQDVARIQIESAGSDILSFRKR